MTAVPDETMRNDHPDLAAAGAAMRAEWRDEAEEAGRDAAEQWQHSRTLRDRLVECMHRGDRVSVVFADQRVTGEVLDVADDLLALRTVAGRIDVHVVPGMPLLIQVVERAPSGGRRAEGARGGFRASLLTRELEGEEVTVATTVGNEPLDGRLAVGADHVCIVGRGGAETFVPLGSIAYVRPRRD